MHWHRNAFLEAWGDGDLTRPTMGARDEPLPPWADRQRRPGPCRRRRAGRPGSERHRGQPAQRARRAALAVAGLRRAATAPAPRRGPWSELPGRCPRVSGGERWPLSSSPGRTSPGRCCPGSRPASGRTGPTSHPRRPSPGQARTTDSAGLDVLQGKGRPFEAGSSGGSLRRLDRPDCTADIATPLPRYCDANATPLLARAAVPAAAAFLQVDSPLGPESPAKSAGDSGPCGEWKLPLAGQATPARGWHGVAGCRPGSQDFKHSSGVPWPGFGIGCSADGGER